jgi:hypothetical protein
MPFATQITKGNRYCPPFPRFTHLRTSAPAPSPPCPALSPTSPLHWKLEPHQLQSHQHQHFIASSHHPPPASGKGGETLCLFRLFPSSFGWQFELSAFSFVIWVAIWTYHPAHREIHPVVGAIFVAEASPRGRPAHAKETLSASVTFFRTTFARK